MSKIVRRGESAPDLAEWFRSIGVLREDGRVSLPVLDRCASCRSAPGCGSCPGCRAGQVCHHLPPCPSCGAVQTAALERLVRHPLHRQLYGDTPEHELFQTGNGALFLQSVAALGVIEPVLGLEADEDDETGANSGDVLILSGWRRVLAARACGATSMPVRLVDPDALPRRADVDLVIVSANFQRQKTIDEIRNEVQVWKRAIAQASIRPPRPWELRLIVAKVMGISVRAVQQAEAMAANDRLGVAEQRLGLGRGDTEEILSDDLATSAGADLSMVARLRQEQQPGDLRGSDIISALVERNEPLLSEERDEVVHESLGRAAQTAEGTFVLDVEDVAPLWTEHADESSHVSTLDSETDARLSPTVTMSAAYGGCEEAGQLNGHDVDGHARSEANKEFTIPPTARVGKLTVHRGTPDNLPFAALPAVDLIVAAPSWFEPLVRPLLTPSHVPFVLDWRDRLRQCLNSWRRVIRLGGRLLLIVPLSTPLYPGLPVLSAAIDELGAADWAIGGTLVLDDPSLHGPLYAVPHADQVLPPKGPARLIIACAPVLADVDGTLEERWRQSWATPLSGTRPREVATVEEAALSHLWKYAGPGRRARWLPDFHPGLTYHLLRIFSRPDATVFLPELGGANLARGCLRTGRRVVALAEIPEQIHEVVNRLRREDKAQSRSGCDPNRRNNTSTSDMATARADVGDDND